MTVPSGVYRINLGSGWHYIGSAHDLAKRKSAHLCSLKDNCHKNVRMQTSWNKYGGFEFNIIEYCPKTETLVREQHYLDIHFDDPKNLNICRTAGNTAGVRPTDATKEKTAQSVKTSAKAIAQRERLHNSPENTPRLRALAEKRIGVSLLDDHKTHISIAVTKWWATRRLEGIV